MKSASLNADLGETFVRDILERERDPSVGKLTKLAETLGLSIGELLDGVGMSPDHEQEIPELVRVSNDEIFDDDPDFVVDDNHHAAHRALKRKLRPGEVIERDARGGMGTGGHASVITADGVTVDAVSATWTFPVAFLHAELRAREADVDIIPVDGDSMIPTLLPGDRVMIQRSATRPSPDGLFAIDDGIGVSVKRLQIVRGSDPLMVRIISDNPQHSTDTILAESLKVLGRVICKVTRL
ncbi:Peptidase S24-like [Kaistia soli DSM 19436]|uniref:Peptidase S24-like n=2 Tax=Kaistia TaxID=166953 RepID=A0A1M5MNV0_9HYPH|nr:Peptidase S24-like [Kaistia soli DSM 19436]